MIKERVVLDITPRQAALVLAALRAELRHEGTIIDSGDAQRVRAVIAQIKDQGVV
jgi:hypothetical protein